MQAICAMIRSTTQPMFAEYIGKYKINAIELEHLTLGTLPPIIQGRFFIVLVILITVNFEDRKNPVE